MALERRIRLTAGRVSWKELLPKTHSSFNQPYALTISGLLGSANRMDARISVPKSDMNGMESVQLFDPWQGLKYQTGYSGVRTLVLGESTYLRGKTREEFEREYCSWRQSWFNGAIQEYRAGKWTHQYWTKWIKAFLGRLPNLKDRQAVLDAVAFYNFGDVVLDGSRMPLSSRVDYQIDQARKKFDSLCEVLEPRLIVVLGYRLWEELPLHGEKGLPIGRFETWHYGFGVTGSVALSLPHPSTSAWRSDETHAALKDVLERVSSTSVASISYQASISLGEVR